MTFNEIRNKYGNQTLDFITELCMRKPICNCFNRYGLLDRCNLTRPYMPYHLKIILKQKKEVKNIIKHLKKNETLYRNLKWHDNLNLNINWKYIYIMSASKQ